MIKRNLKKIEEFSYFTGWLVLSLLQKKITTHFAAYLILKWRWRQRALPLSLYVTSACGLRCEHCIMDGIMKSDPKYHMSLDELRHFIKKSEDSRYKFDIVLTGGEPSIWRNLAEGLKLLKASSVTRTVTMFTNASNIEAFSTGYVIENLDSVRVSRYSTNTDNVTILANKFPSKTSIVPRDEFWINPSSAVSHSLPAKCLNPEILIYDNQVFACPHSESIARKSEQSIKLSRPIEYNFLRGLSVIKFMQQRRICTRCISNGKVRQQAQKVPNLGKHERRSLKVLS